MRTIENTWTALITPFKDGAIDLRSLTKLVHHQLENGVQGFVVNGTTAESPTLTEEETKKIFETVRREAGSSVPILLGTGTNDTAEACRRTRWADEWNADGALVVVPYYNKPPQRCLIEHFRAVAATTDKPVVLYNVPSRTVVGLNTETVVELAAVNNIVGIKDATGDFSTLGGLQKIAKRPFWLLSGDDGTAVEFCTRGGHGVISVISHVIPKEMSDFIHRARRKDGSVSTEWNRFAELLKWTYVEANPIPVKMALYWMGLIASPELRLPLSALDRSHYEGFQSCLKQLSKI